MTEEGRRNDGERGAGMTEEGRRNDGERRGAIGAGSLPSTPHLTSPLEGGRDELGAHTTWSDGYSEKMTGRGRDELGDAHNAAALVWLSALL